MFTGSVRVRRTNEKISTIFRRSHVDMQMTSDVTDVIDVIVILINCLFVVHYVVVLKIVRSSCSLPTCIMTESDSDTSFFPRCPDKQFWADDDRVQTLITLYHNAECLWNLKCADYKKSLTKKKTAKEETGLHFG